MKDKLTKANGLLTPSEFLEELKKNGLEIDGRYYTDVSLCNNFLNIDADKVIKKWIGESEFTYREYDGQLCMTDNYKKSKLYQRILRENSCRTNVKKGFFEESLSVGDKDTLHYCMNITVEVKKPLTAEYAKELAKKIIA